MLKKRQLQLKTMIHSFNKCSLRATFALDIFLGAGNAGVNKTQSVSLWNFTFQRRRQTGKEPIKMQHQGVLVTISKDAKCKWRIVNTQFQTASRSLLTYVEMIVPYIKFAQNEMTHHVDIINCHVGEGVSEKLQS